MLRTAALLAGRSFFPLLAVAIIAGTLWWGPWASLTLAVIAWRAAARWA